MYFGCSTAWNAWTAPGATQMTFDIKKLSFDSVELSFNLTPEMVDEVAGLVDAKDIQVLSVHNYCPIPSGWERQDALPDCYSVASPDARERAQAVACTCRTIDTAARLGAQAVVLHAGRVEIPDGTRQLIEYYRQGKKETQEYRETKARLIEDRHRHSQVFLDNTLRSLEELAPYAQAQGVKIGIETRFYYSEIPSFEEIGIILKRFEGAPVFYWHDTGHAQLMEDLGFVRHRDYLETYGSRMIGLHLHNIINGQDHQAPTQGEIDFGAIAPYVTAGMIKIIEAHERAEGAQLKASKALLEAIFDGKH
jgi:sugar phosphate isomerase/epimerase